MRNNESQRKRDTYRVNKVTPFESLGAFLKCFSLKPQKREFTQKVFIPTACTVKLLRPKLVLYRNKLDLLSYDFTPTLDLWARLGAYH